MILRLRLDDETSERLSEAATVERRPLAMQAEVLIRRALKLPKPRPAKQRVADYEAVPSATH